MSGAGGNANITGNPADYISIVETGDTTGWIFTQDYLNVNDTSCKLNVTTNRLHWTVSVSDNLDDTKLIQPGHMVEWTTSYGSKYLTDPMKIGGVGVPLEYTAVAPTDLTGSPGVIWTGADDVQGVGVFDPIPITIQQWVSHQDQSLTDGVYRIVVTFTAGTV